MCVVLLLQVYLTRARFLLSVYKGDMASVIRVTSYHLTLVFIQLHCNRYTNVLRSFLLTSSESSVERLSNIRCKTIIPITKVPSYTHCLGHTIPMTSTEIASVLHISSMLVSSSFIIPTNFNYFFWSNNNLAFCVFHWIVVFHSVL